MILYTWIRFLFGVAQTCATQTLKSLQLESRRDASVVLQRIEPEMSLRLKKQNYLRHCAENTTQSKRPVRYESRWNDIGFIETQ